ncbi:MAG: hypothetical protein ACRC1G_22460 [Bradyrhizobium sp.]|nr:hypothetical protein [Bradyrhizobium sp.]
MSIFTGSELEFLAGLNKSWWLLYWKEFSRLRLIEAAAADNPAAGPAGLGASGEDPTGFFQRDRAAGAVQRRVELAALNR